MLFYLTRHIVIHRGAKHKSILRFALHSLSINIIHLLIILNQPSFINELTKILYSLFINIIIMLILPHREIYLRLNDVIQRLLISLSLFAGLFGIENIIRTRCNILNKSFGRTHPPERFYFHTIDIIISLNIQQVIFTNIVIII